MFQRIWLSPQKEREARNEMIAITTRISTMVKPHRRLFLRAISFSFAPGSILCTGRQVAKAKLQSAFFCTTCRVFSSLTQPIQDNRKSGSLKNHPRGVRIVAAFRKENMR